MDNKKRRPKKAGLFLMLAVLALLSGCSKKADDVVKVIQKEGVLKVAVVDTDSRYTTLENGQPTGVEPELAEYIAGALGVQTQYQVKEKEEALAALASGEAHIALGCINASGSLTTDYLVSTPYGKGFFYAVTRKGDFALTIGSFADSKLGVTKNLDEATKTRLYEADGITIETYDSLEEAARAVKDGVIRAYICYEDQAKSLLKEENLQVQNISNLDPEEFVVVAPKNSQTLVGGINTLIRQFLEKE